MMREELPKAFAIKPKPVVLFTGPARIDDKLLADLNRLTLAVPANFPGTAVAHVGTPAALTQKLAEKKG